MITVACPLRGKAISGAEGSMELTELNYLDLDTSYFNFRR